MKTMSMTMAIKRAQGWVGGITRRGQRHEYVFYAPWDDRNLGAEREIVAQTYPAAVARRCRVVARLAAVILEPSVNSLDLEAALCVAEKEATDSRRLLRAVCKELGI